MKENILKATAFAAGIGVGVIGICVGIRIKNKHDIDQYIKRESDILDRVELILSKNEHELNHVQKDLKLKIQTVLDGRLVQDEEQLDRLDILSRQFFDLEE